MPLVQLVFYNLLEVGKALGALNPVQSSSFTSYEVCKEINVKKYGVAWLSAAAIKIM